MAKLIYILLLTSWLANPLPVRINVVPRASFHPGAVRITVKIISDDRNRDLCYGYEGPSYRRSCVPIEGAERHVTFEQIYTNIPPGDYQAFADLFQVLPTKSIHVETYFQVIGDEPNNP